MHAISSLSDQTGAWCFEAMTLPVALPLKKRSPHTRTDLHGDVSCRNVCDYGKQTYHRVVHDIALGRPLGHVQGSSHNEHIITAPGKCLHKTLKPCPVVSALQGTNSIRAGLQCTSGHAVSSYKCHQGTA